MSAPISLPPFEASAMDGYAVRSEDCRNKETHLSVVGSSFAGVPYEGSVPQGSTVRIFTGAAVPKDCDAVILQEDVLRKNDRIETQTDVSPGENVRHTGTDIREGALLLKAGTKLSAFEIAWLAACGVQSVTTTRKVQIAVFSTGDELQDPGQPLTYGQIYDSNRQSLKAMLVNQPVSIVDLGRLPDNQDQIERTLQEVSDKVDIIVTSGGVSVGDADYVRPAVQKLGQLSFWNVALKPGKPIAVGRVGKAWFFGLPGNPVSAVVTYLLFVTPALDRLSGAPVLTPSTLPATLTQALSHTKGRREYQRGWLSRVDDQLFVSQTGDQSSNRLSSLVAANCLIIVPESRGVLPKGTLVDVLLLPKESPQLGRGL